MEQRDMNQFEQILNELKDLREMLLTRTKPFLNMDEAALYLGISKNTLYGYTSRGILPFHKLQGRRVYFSVDDLNRFVLNAGNRNSN